MKIRRDEMIHTGTLRLRVRVAGSGPPLLFTSTGWGASADLYIATMPELAERFTVAWIDPRGTAQSDRPQEGDYTFGSFMNDFDAVRHALGWNASWIGGHSMGGYLAQLYAATYPDRCTGLLAICTYGAMDDQFQHEVQARIKRRSHEPWYEASSPAFEREIFTDDDLATYLDDILPFYFLDQDVMEQQRPAFRETTFSVNAIKGVYASNTDHSVLAKLKGIDVPSVIVVADGDFICSPPLGQLIHLALRGSKLVLIENSGHFPWIEQRDLFWSSVDSALDALQRTG